MKTVVVDSSAVLIAIGEKGAAADDATQRLAELDCHAPHLADAEVGNVLRRRVLAEQISVETAETGLGVVRWLIDERYPHVGPLAEVAWKLRTTSTFYDALYLALASSLDVPLLTADARLARAPKLPCEVEVLA